MDNALLAVGVRVGYFALALPVWAVLFAYLIR
jgi:hypothetical protein